MQTDIYSVLGRKQKAVLIEVDYKEDKAVLFSLAKINNDGSLEIPQIHI